MIAVEQRGNVFVLSPRRDVDLANATELASVIVDAGKDRSVVISLAECSYCDSAGLAVFVAAKKYFGHQFAMYIPKDSSVRHLFEVTNTLDYLSVFSALEDATHFVSEATDREDNV